MTRRTGRFGSTCATAAQKVRDRLRGIARRANQNRMRIAIFVLLTSAAQVERFSHFEIWIAGWRSDDFRLVVRRAASEEVSQTLPSRRHLMRPRLGLPRSRQRCALTPRMRKEERDLQPVLGESGPHRGKLHERSRSPPSALIKKRLPSLERSHIWQTPYLANKTC